MVNVNRTIFNKTVSEYNVLSTCNQRYFVSVRHARNLIWAQTPSLKIGVSRIVGIEGDPTEWVPSGNVQVRHIR